MAQIKGSDSTTDYHHGNPPWSEQVRAVPLRTFSGSIVYKRKKHVWRMKDIERVVKAAELFEENPPDGWLKELLWKIKDVSIKLLEKILEQVPFLEGVEARELYDMIYIMLGKIFKVDTDWMNPNVSSGESLIYLIASKFNLDVTIKRR